MYVLCGVFGDRDIRSVCMRWLIYLSLICNVYAIDYHLVGTCINIDLRVVVVCVHIYTNARVLGRRSQVLAKPRYPAGLLGSASVVPRLARGR